jgi:hypothetical protein
VHARNVTTLGLALCSLSSAGQVVRIALATGSEGVVQRGAPSTQGAQHVTRSHLCRFTECDDNVDGLRSVCS